MNSSLRKLLPGSVALLAMLALAAFAQQPAASAEKSERAPAPAESAPPAPAEAEKPANAEPPLRRIDQPANGGAGRRRGPSFLHRRHGGSSDFPLGDHVVPKESRMRGAVSILGSTTVEGEVDSDAVSVLGATTIASGAKVGGAAVAVLGRLVSEGEIQGEAVSVLGGMEINGHVGGEAVSVLGNLTLGPKAIVDGDLVLVGGELKRDPDAIVHGNLVNVPVMGFVGGVDWLTTWVKRCLLLGRPLAFGPHLGWAWSVAFAFLAFYLVLALLFGRAIDKCVETFEARPGSSILAAVLAVLLSPVAIILLAVTVVGALLIPFLGAGLMFANLFGKAVMLAWIGRRITRLAGGGRLGHPFFSVLVGGLIVMLLYTIWGSFLLYKLLSWIGLGVVVYTIALSLKREKPAAAAAGAGKTPPPPPPVPPAVPGGPLSGIVASVPLATPPPAASSGFVGASAPVEPPPSVVPPVPPPPVAAGAAVPPMPPSPPAVVISAATLPRAGFFVRLAAMILDLVLVGLVLGFGSHFVPRFLRFDFNPGSVLLVLAAYAAVMWKLKGTTIGGVICGLKVVRLDQRELDWVTAIVRAVSCFLSLCAAGLGFIWVAFDDERQSWHDKIAGTTVVRVPRGVALL